MDKCCGTCSKWQKNSPHSKYGDCQVSAPAWVFMSLEADAWLNNTTTRKDGAHCWTYEPKITLDKPHRPT